MPAAQAEQEEAPLPLKLPSLHAAQAALVVPPALGLAVPAAHGEQEGWPSAGWYEPAAQLVQEEAPLLLKEPTAQLMQENARAALKNPAVQLVQDDAPAALKEPAPQTVQFGAPAALNVPEAQGEQEVWPGLTW